MTTFRFRGVHAALTALWLVSCSNESAANVETGVVQSSHTAEIVRIIRKSGSAEIERELAALLQRIYASGGSPGTELVDAGFTPVPAMRQIYSWEGTGRDGRIGVGVTIDEETIRVTAKKGGWR